MAKHDRVRHQIPFAYFTKSLSVQKPREELHSKHASHAVILYSALGRSEEGQARRAKACHRSLIVEFGMSQPRVMLLLLKVLHCRDFGSSNNSLVLDACWRYHSPCDQCETYVFMSCSQLSGCSPCFDDNIVSFPWPRGRCWFTCFSRYRVPCRVRREQTIAHFRQP